MKIVLWISSCLLIPVLLTAQKYHSRSGVISFRSDAVLEIIKSDSDKAYSSLDPASGKVSCSVKVRSFQFSKPLMYKHFNENYLESHLYPDANFTGYIQNMKEVKFRQPGQYTALIKGELEIHGITREITVETQVRVLEKSIHMATNLDVVLEDYNIDIPAFVRDNIAKKIKLSIDVTFPFGK